LTMHLPDRFYDPFAGGIRQYLHIFYEKNRLFEGEINAFEMIKIAEHFHEVVWPQSILPIINDATISPMGDEDGDIGITIWTKGL